MVQQLNLSYQEGVPLKIGNSSYTKANREELRLERKGRQEIGMAKEKVKQLQELVPEDVINEMTLYAKQQKQQDK